MSSNSAVIDRGAVANSSLLQERAVKSLRITCYGSSSSSTPDRYLQAARALGYLLGRRGHVCVNGAGAYGCMAALNEGAEAGGGHIVGVIHEMWLKTHDSTLRDGGAHPVFESTENAAAPSSNSTTNRPSSSSAKPMREMLVARGKDLQERKRLLVQNADALIVLPGGPGTWDELWEMACARGIGLSTLPIVCVNCDGYYDPFYEILVRAYEEQLTKFRPEELVQFVDTAEEAVRWVEVMHHPEAHPGMLKPRPSVLRKSSLLHVPPMEGEFGGERISWYLRVGLVFTAGFVAGAVAMSGRWHRR
jgi:uncharacterized protein (TIGR00730 family)